MVRHVLPNIVAPAVVYISLDVGGLLLSISALSFLGLGVRPPTAELGSLLSDARNYIGAHPSLMLYPGLAIFVFVVGCNLLGDGVRDILDPKTRKTERIRARLRRGRRRPAGVPGVARTYKPRPWSTG